MRPIEKRGPTIVLVWPAGLLGSAAVVPAVAPAVGVSSPSEHVPSSR